MFVEVVDSLALWRFREMVNMRIATVESIEKNDIVSSFTSLSLEEFDFILNTIKRKLFNDEKQDFVCLLFDTIAEVADAASAEKIELKTIRTHNSITIPIRTQEVDIASRWFAQRISSTEEYLLLVTHAYHVYTATYYSIILLPHFKNAFYVPINAKKLYLTTVTDNIRALMLKHYHQKITANPQDIENIKSFFISYAQLMFIKLLYVMYMHTKIKNDDDAEIYFNYIRQQSKELLSKYSVT
jgi:hypothetical protein